MRTFLQRCVLFFLVAWLFVASVGFSWAQSTCVFTGVQKSSWNSNAQCCAKKQSSSPANHTSLSRASCCHYKHFQVKQQVFSVHKKFSNWMTLATFERENYAVFIQKKWSVLPLEIFDFNMPLRQTHRRAFLQIYLI